MYQLAVANITFFDLLDLSLLEPGGYLFNLLSKLFLYWPSFYPSTYLSISGDGLYTFLSFDIGIRQKICSRKYV